VEKQKSELFHVSADMSGLFFIVDFIYYSFL